MAKAKMKEEKAQQVLTRFIELEVIKITSGDDALNPSLYPSDGLYLVDDGIAYAINSVVNGIVSNTLYIPHKNVIEPLKKSIETTIIEALESKLDASVDNILDRFDNTIAVLNDFELNSSNTDIKDLVKIIAIAQNPDLIGEVLGND